MKYWLLTTEYPPFFGGGISTYCYFTVQMLSEKGHEVSVFVNDFSVNDIVIDHEKNVRVIRFNPSRTNSSSFLGHVTNTSYEFAHAVKYFIDREGKPDVIECQEYQGIAYYLLQYKCLLYDWCRDVPVVITMHSPSFLYLEYNHVPLYKYPNYWIGEMERFCLRAADLIISPSKFLLSEVKKKYDFANPNVLVIPNPYRGDGASENQQRLSSSPEQIIFYGKLSVQKGIFKLLGYFNKLWQEGFTTPLYLIGGQDIFYYPEGMRMGDFIRRRYKNFIRKGLLILEDKISPAKIKERLTKAKVIIVPSTVENLPYVVFEMMSLGRIVLASQQGGHAEIIENAKSGFIFDHTNPQTFYDQLHKILALRDTERGAISENAISRVSDYSFESIYSQKIGALEKLFANKNIVHDFPFIQEKEIGKATGNANFEKGLLSVVVPYYNMGRYIDETMRSLEEVSYSAREIIIINDGSTDKKSIAKLEHYRTYPGVTVYDSENKGLAHARNYGASLATGEYVAFLDADDMVAPVYYEKAIKVLQCYNNVHFAGCWTQYFESSEKVWPAFNPEPPLILYHNLVNSSALIFKRNIFLSHGQNDPHMAFQGLEDYETVISLLSKGYNGIVLPEILFHYRVRRDSMIRSISISKKLNLYQYISNKHKHFYAIFAADLFNLLNANGPGIFLDNPSLDYQLAGHLPLGNKLSEKLIGYIKRNKYAKNLAYKVYRYINKQV